MDPTEPIDPPRVRLFCERCSETRTHVIRPNKTRFCSGCGQRQKLTAVEVHAITEMLQNQMQNLRE